MQLRFKPAFKWVNLTLAALLFTAVSAAPITNADINPLDCVKVDIPSAKASGDQRFVLSGEDANIKIDMSGCDSSMVNRDDPVKVTLVDVQHGDPINIDVSTKDHKDYTWKILQHTIPCTTKEHYIKVESVTKKDGYVAIGRSDPFTISCLASPEASASTLTATLQTRGDDLPLIAIDSIPPSTAIDPAQPEAPEIDANTPEKEVATPGPVSATFSPAPPTASPEDVDPSIAAPPLSEAPVFPSDAVPSTPVEDPLTALPAPIDITPIPQSVPETPAIAPEDLTAINDALSSAPAAADVGGAFSTPGGLSTAAVTPDTVEGDPEALAKEQERQNKSISKTFFKYAGIGSAALSLVGTALGGIVGGAVGAVTGLVTLLDKTHPDYDSFSLQKEPYVLPWTIFTCRDVFATLYAIRFIQPRAPGPIAIEQKEKILSRFGPKQFWSVVRVYPGQFEHIVSLIENNDVFESPDPLYPQAPVRTQLAVALFRLSSKGISAEDIALALGETEGTIHEYTNHCIQAICELEEQFITWPDDERKEEIVKWFRSERGFPEVIGIVDATAFSFESAPAYDTAAWKTKKHGHAMGCTVVCDHTGRFTFASTGYKGSVGDWKAYCNTRLYTHKRDYFAEEEFLLADIEYDITPTVISPYEESKATDDELQFNALHEEARDMMVYALGWLRLKWSSLQGLPMEINKSYDTDRALDWIMTCLILHNICLEHPDGLETGDVYRCWQQKFENVSPYDFEYHIKNIGLRNEDDDNHPSDDSDDGEDGEDHLVEG
ncbi:nuclease HARBI1 [Entomortierella parvispora]|uniref:Putative nuclease HARBI1 n=1 Tax=Entomortierella parvispora TaxID=205924 RepID=A0A9P3LVU0_9FUNG|nr:nuclease HARBI1 [Entomortierella parvispora]